MQCRDVVLILTGFEAGALPSGLDDSLDPLIASGWIAPVPHREHGALDALREQARGLQAELRSGSGDRAAVQARLADVRRRLFDAAEADDPGPTVDVGGVAHALTWRGRELLDELRPRVGRVADRDVTAFVDEMAGLRALLRGLARRARELADRLANEPDLSEQVARLAAIGLAATPELELQAAAARWITAWRRFHPLTDEVLAAGCAEAVAVGRLDVDGVMREARWGNASVDGRALTIAVVSLVGGRRREPPSGFDPLAWALLGVRGEVDADAVDRVTALGRAVGGDALEHAALVELAGEGGLERWRGLLDGLERILPVRVDGLASMLVLIQADAAEILDDLRLAAEVVVAERLASGGAEALSLAGKLLLVAATEGGSALLPDAVGPVVAGAVRGALRLPSSMHALYRTLAPVHVDFVHQYVATWVQSHPGHRSTYYG